MAPIAQGCLENQLTSTVLYIAEPAKQLELDVVAFDDEGSSLVLVESDEVVVAGETGLSSIKPVVVEVGGLVACEESFQLVSESRGSDRTNSPSKPFARGVTRSFQRSSSEMRQIGATPSASTTCMWLF